MHCILIYILVKFSVENMAQTKRRQNAQSVYFRFILGSFKFVSLVRVTFVVIEFCKYRVWRSVAICVCSFNFPNERNLQSKGLAKIMESTVLNTVTTFAF